MNTIFDHLEAYKQQNPDFEETMRIYHEVMPIYRETMQIMLDIEYAMHPYTITTSGNTTTRKDKQA